MSRRKAREAAFKVLFQVEQANAEPDKALLRTVDEYPLAEKDQRFTQELIGGTLEHICIIDQRIAEYSKEWSLQRMSSVDRNIMRIACYEILFYDDSQPVVAINEAIEMAKRYGDENSPSFVNAILDRIKNK